MYDIIFTEHCKLRLQQRNTNEDEVKIAIEKGIWQKAEKNRKSAKYIFVFKDYHYGKYYETKEVVPIFIEEKDKILVITVYTYFSQRRL